MNGVEVMYIGSVASTVTAFVLFFCEVLIYLSQMAETAFTTSNDPTNTGKGTGWMFKPLDYRIK